MHAAPAHAIDVDPAGYVRIRLSGFFDPPAIAAFVADRRAAFARLRCPANTHVCLCDISQCVLQSQEAFAAFKPLLAEPAARSRRMAFVVGGSLARMQVRRLVEGRADIAIFDDVASAEAWLDEALAA